MSHVFISYVREDSSRVDRLCGGLKDGGVKIWIDRRDILPGARWKSAIRAAIAQGDYFVACFSPAYLKRNSTYMNEELTIAIETLRQKPTDRPWFIPVLLEPCEVPDREIGAGETLHDLQLVNLHEDWEAGITAILAVVSPGTAADQYPWARAAESSPTAPRRPGPAAQSLENISVLYVAANPGSVVSTHVDRELREIQEKAQLSALRERFDFRFVAAARLADLRRALLESAPRVVHFAGHSTENGAILLEGASGSPDPVNATDLAQLLALFQGKIQCVIFNMCHSGEYAQELAMQVPYVIGIPGEISDELAIAFSVGFYQGLGSGRSIPFSFEVAINSMKLSGDVEEGSVKLFCSRPRRR